MQTIDLFDKFLQPIAEVEKELKSGFEEKVKAKRYREFTVDEVSLFLNVCGIGEQICQQRGEKIDGEVLEAAICDVTLMNAEDKLARKKIKFYLKVLESGKLLNEEELEKSVVWRHRDVEKTRFLLKEWGIPIDTALVKKKEITICHLLYFKYKDFREEFGLELNEGRDIVLKLHKIRKNFEEFLSS